MPSYGRLYSLLAQVCSSLYTFTLISLLLGLIVVVNIL